MIKNCFLTVVTLLFISPFSFSQSTISGSRVITTAVPFLAINPSARASGMGEAGVATSPDVFSQHNNPAKFAFYEANKNEFGEFRKHYLFIKDTVNLHLNLKEYRYKSETQNNFPDSAYVNSLELKDKVSIGVSYTPWLISLVGDLHLVYLTGLIKLKNDITLSSSFKYFSLGEIVFRDDVGSVSGLVNPYEFAADFSFSKKLSEKLAGAVSFRYIHSDIYSGQMINGVETKAGKTVAADVALYYKSVLQNENIITGGLLVQNLGPYMSYTNEKSTYSLPTLLKLGGGYTFPLPDNSSLHLSLEVNKYLVPSMPGPDTANVDNGDIINNPLPDRSSVLEGVVKSFYDAPGGFEEELKEINLLFGAEFILRENYVFRSGYHYEHKNKGNRKFITFGTGIILGKSQVDLSYYLPTTKYHPFKNTFKIGFSMPI